MPTYYDVIKKKGQRDNALTVLLATCSRYTQSILHTELDIDGRGQKDITALTKAAIMYTMYDAEYEQLKKDADG